MTARLGLVMPGILAAVGLAEGVLRGAAALDPRVRFLATGRATRPAVTYATLEDLGTEVVVADPDAPPPAPGRRADHLRPELGDRAVHLHSLLTAGSTA